MNDKMFMNVIIDVFYDCSVVDQFGNKIGEIGQVYFDDVLGQLVWVIVKIGFFGCNEIFVFFKGLEILGDQICVFYIKDKVKDVLNVDFDGYFFEDEIDEFYCYYFDIFVLDLKVVDINMNQGVVGQKVVGIEFVVDIKVQIMVDQKFLVVGDGLVVCYEECFNVGKE